MRVSSITVCPDRVDVMVAVEDAAELRTSTDPRIARRALELLPGLARHRCENGSEAPFVEEIEDTELPHLFEHIVLELMAQAGSPRSLRGETTWDFKRDGRGVFRVSVEYDDDLVCLGAIKTANALVCHLLGEADEPDIARARQHLVSLRARPTEAERARPA